MLQVVSRMADTRLPIGTQHRHTGWEHPFFMNDLLMSIMYTRAHAELSFIDAM